MVEGKTNKRNGSGKGIDFVNFPTGEVTTNTIPDYNKEYARGVRCNTSGTLAVKLVNMDADVNIPVTADFKELYDIEVVRASGGTITPDGTNVMLFW